MTDFVCIHLSLPKLQDDPNLRWVPSFRVPVARILPWSLHPYTLLRYMCFATTGARGELSLSSQYPVDPVAYNSSTLPNDIPDLQVYYHVQEDQRSYTFPIDPIDVASGWSTPITPTENFTEGLVGRDGGVCIVHSLPGELCDAAHLVDVSKGDKYIEQLTTSRSLNNPNPQIIQDVDDLRNGLFLLGLITPFIGISVAFLPIPNVYMTSNDIDNLPPATSSLILHDLNTPVNAPKAYTSGIPDGGLVRIAPHDWPPNLLFDVVFAEAMSRLWGLPGFVDQVIPAWSIQTVETEPDTTSRDVA
ncbi:hypothetical protein EV702DRAFT_1220110 [Suillus placidus]|uniref:HNH nuclease domain-containing protein n=1 Tax=Suillus placidus TaxID=48579 RepID=A0A9P7D3N9_9AGAM|nr:hypothetical protein EV702DRAFT_1220110 [Suillus placidus]